ncbi:MAG: DUF2079 domain-containing protein [Deltaproteobacteria bacterium]|nr:DUF2079 domain-containing protein [Deltaproteobacteria bacterium]
MRPPSPRAERAAALVVVVAAALYTLLHGAIAAWTWRSLRPAWGLDLTYFHSQVWNAARGAGFTQTVHWHESQSLFGNTHFNPILLLGIPSQWVAPGLDSLLATQCALVALGALAVYRLARSHGAGPSLGAGAAVMFLMQEPLWRVTQSDVRPLVWAVPFLLMLAAALAEQRRREALVWALLACLCREELPVIVAFLALIHAAGTSPAMKRRWRIAAAVGAGALGLLVAAVLIRPASDTYIEPGMWILESLGWPLDLPRGVGPLPVWVDRFWDRLLWLAQWAFPAGLLALAAPRLLFGSLPLFGYLLTTDVGWADWDGEGPHYTAPAVAFVGGAAAVALGRIARQAPTGPAPFAGRVSGAGGRPRLAWALLAGVLAVQGWQAKDAWSGWIHDDISGARSADPALLAVRELVAGVPDEAPVMADFTTVHLFAGREVLYCYERDAMRDGVDAHAPGELLPQRVVQPQWALIPMEHQDWVRRAEAHDLIEQGRTEDFVLLGPAGGARPARVR